MEKRRLLADALTSEAWKILPYARFSELVIMPLSVFISRIAMKEQVSNKSVLGAYFHNTFPTQSALYTSVIDWIIPTQDRFCVHTHPLQECFCYLPVVCKVTIKSRKAFGRCCYYEQVRVCLF